MRIAQTFLAPLRLRLRAASLSHSTSASSDIPSDRRPHLAIIVAVFGLLWLRLHRSPVFLVRLRQAGMESVRTPQTFRTVPRSLIIDPWLAVGSTWPTDAGDPRLR